MPGKSAKRFESAAATLMPVLCLVEALDGGFLDGAVHALDLTVGPRVLGLSEAVVDVAASAGQLEGMRGSVVSLLMARFEG